MEFEKLFSVLVLSGAMLTSGCGKKDEGAPATTTPVDAPTETQHVAGDPSADIPPPAAPAPEAQRTAAVQMTKDGERCDEVCTGHTDDGEMVCPIGTRRRNQLLLAHDSQTRMLSYRTPGCPTHHPQQRHDASRISRNENPHPAVRRGGGLNPKG